MNLAASLGLGIGKRIAPFYPAEISTSFEVNLKPADVLALKKSLITDAEITPNLLFEIPPSPTDFTDFILFPPSLLDHDFDFGEADIGLSVSDNLFHALKRRNVDGKNYSLKAEQKQSDLFPQIDKTNRSGLIKAYQRKKTDFGHKTVGLSIWDLIFPSLLPPLDETFAAQFELFHDLLKFQPAGIEFLIQNESALLGDEMGTGKTVMTSVALKLLFRLGKVRKALVVCPMSILRTWQDHLENWADELVLTVVRGPSETRKLDWRFPAHVYITTYDTVKDFLTTIKKNHAFSCPGCKKRLNLGDNMVVGDDETPQYSCPYCYTPLNEYMLSKLPKKESLIDIEVAKTFDVVILDEAQYIKNAGSQRSRAVRLFGPKFRWALTGTPMENRLDDLVSIFKFVKPGLFKNERFLSGHRASELIKPHFLRRMKKDVMKDLPPKIEQELWLELNDEQRRAYAAAESAGVAEIESMDSVTKIHIFALITKLKRICNFVPGTLSSCKINELKDLVEEIKANGQKVLVFTQYLGEGTAKLEQQLSRFGVVVLTGAMSADARQTAINRFKSDPNISVFLATIRSGGVGLTLTEASYVIHFDHWWNPATMWQANDRVHRTGQVASQVNIYSFWTQNTIEEKIHRILKQKGLLFDEVINNLSEADVDSRISTDEWLEIIGVKPKGKR